MTTVMVILLFLATTVAADITYFKDEGFVAWDAVTKLVDGSDIPTTDDPPLYRVEKKHKITNAITPMGETTNIQYPANIDAEGAFYIGVYCVRMFDGAPVTYTDLDDGLVKELKSTKTWSNSTDIEAVPVPFALVSFLALEKVRNLRHK